MPVNCRDWQVMGAQIALDPSKLSRLSALANNTVVATMTFEVPSTCDGGKTLTVGLGGEHSHLCLCLLTWGHYRLSPTPVGHGGATPLWCCNPCDADALVEQTDQTCTSGSICSRPCVAAVPRLQCLGQAAAGTCLIGAVSLM